MKTQTDYRQPWRESGSMPPDLDEPDELGIALLKSGPSAYAVGPHGVIVLGMHTTCIAEGHGIICMGTITALFDLEAHCVGCGMTYRFALEDDDKIMDFVAWGMSMLRRGWTG